MSQRRVVGIDLGIASKHTVVVLREDGSEVCRRSCEPTRESLEEIERAALNGVEAQTKLEVVMEPTGEAWLPVAVFFSNRGHLVHRVSSAKSADLRRYFSRHAKSNRIDANTLAQMPLMDHESMRLLALPDGAQARLQRRVRVCHRLTRDISESKTRLRSLVRAMLPKTPLVGDLSKTDLAILERTGADPQRLVKLGLSGLSRLTTKVSNGHLGREYAERWLRAAQSARELYEGHEAMPYEDHAAEIMTEIVLLHAYEVQLALQEKAREDAYLEADPQQLVRSVPGFAEVGGPVVTSFVGDASRFPGGGHLRSFTGLAPRAAETGDSDPKGQHMSKAGPGLARTTFIRGADTARQQDPQLARIYYLQMTVSGASHLKALCVVASHLTERVYRVLRRRTPYELRDVDGRAVTAAEAKALIKENWTVPEEVRRKRRSKKTRKAPQQVLNGNAKRTRRARARQPSPASILPPSSTPETTAGTRTHVPV